MKDTSNTSSYEYQKIRKKIDDLDQQVLINLLERFYYVKKIRNLKKDQGDSLDDLLREKEIFENLKILYKTNVLQKNKSTPPWSAVVSIFQLIIKTGKKFF